jgi:hypothetical protein
MPKCWTLCDLALSVASGTPWLGFQGTQRPVLLVDLHMDRAMLAHRLDAICREKQLRMPPNLTLGLLRLHPSQCPRTPSAGPLDPEPAFRPKTPPIL